MAEASFTYHEAERSATITLSSGRPFKLSNVSRERAEAFWEKFKAEEAAMVARGERGDPLTFAGPSGHFVRGGAHG